LGAAEAPRLYTGAGALCLAVLSSSPPLMSRGIVVFLAGAVLMAGGWLALALAARL